MPEDMNLEVAHKLTEREEAVRESRRGEEVIEIVGVLLLAVAAVATAWGGFQAAKGDGRQSILYAEAGVDRVQATTVAIAGEQRLASDAATFNQWLVAKSTNDAQLQAMLVRRFSPEYRTAFDAWLKTAPFTTPSAPPGPAYMSEYHNPQLEQAAQPQRGSRPRRGRRHPCARDGREVHRRDRIVCAGVVPGRGEPAPQDMGRAHRRDRDGLGAAWVRLVRGRHPATVLDTPRSLGVKRRAVW
jgi:hypothetical protein